MWNQSALRKGLNHDDPTNMRNFIRRVNKMIDCFLEIGIEKVLTIYKNMGIDKFPLNKI